MQFHIYSIYNARLKLSDISRPPFWFISGWTRIELCTGRCYYQQRWLRHPQKQTQQRWICFQRWFTLSDWMVTMFFTFSPKSHPPQPPHFQWRKFNNRLDYFENLNALMALGIRRSAMENSGQLRYSRKTNGCSYYTPRCSRVNRIYTSAGARVGKQQEFRRGTRLNTNCGVIIIILLRSVLWIPRVKVKKMSNSNCSIAALTLTTQWPELTLGLHCWQLVGKTNVYGTAPTAALHILIANPTSARKDFDPQPKLVLIYRPRKDERLSWPE